MTANERLEREKDRLKEENVRAKRLLMMGIVVLLCLLPILYFINQESFIYFTAYGFFPIIFVLVGYTMLEISKNKVEIEFLDACLKSNLEDERVKPDIKKEFKLSNEYVEIFLKDEIIINEEVQGSALVSSDYNEKKRQRDCGGRFFVRLVNDDEAELIVKRADGKIVGKTQRITRFSYLRELFNHEI